jgi:FixJ family two-component response regulator
MVSSAPPTARRHIVVIAAADADLRHALRFLLQVEGYAVETRDSGEALVASAAGQASCLVVDQDLPGLSGLEALGLLRRRAQTPAVLLVDDVDGHVRDGASLIGVDLIEKPFHGARLLAAVRDAVRRSC